MADPLPAPSPARLRSLDALRGFDMFWIIGAGTLVRGLQGLGDNAASRFLATQLSHVDWEGLRFYDCIYPLFLFLIGVSIVFSTDRSLAMHGRVGTFAHILKRGALLFALGIVYNGGLSTRWPDIRLSGVLGMIAFCYVIAAGLYVLLQGRMRALAATAAAMLCVSWGAMAWTPIPDLQLDKPTLDAWAKKVGSRDPAAIAAAVPERVSGSYAEGKNLSNYLDFRFLPGKKSTVAYDNQGLMSPLTASVICLFGIFAGRWLRDGNVPQAKRGLWLLAAGGLAVAVGLLWSLPLPIVKKLWTSSFCVLSGGIAAMAMAVFYLVIEVWKRDRWCEPFVWIGTNSITIYMAVALVPFDRIARRLVGGDIEYFLNQHVAKGLGGLVVAATTLGLAVLLVGFLHRRRIFLKV